MISGRFWGAHSNNKPREPVLILHRRRDVVWQKLWSGEHTRGLYSRFWVHKLDRGHRVAVDVLFNSYLYTFQIILPADRNTKDQTRHLTCLWTTATRSCLHRGCCARLDHLPPVCAQMAALRAKTKTCAEHCYFYTLRLLLSSKTKFNFMRVPLISTQYYICINKLINKT